MRAYAIASELQFPLTIYAQAEASMDKRSKEYFALRIDQSVATGAIHRQIWHLDRDAQATLDRVLSYALKVRGDAIAERFASMKASGDVPEFSGTKLKEIREALTEAKVDLIEKAPKAAEQETE